MDLTEVPPNTRNGLVAMNADRPLAKVDKAELARDTLNRYLDGKRIEEMAKEYNVTPPRVYRLLLEYVEDDWKKAQAALAIHEYQKAEDELKAASDGVTVARARELLKSQQWKLERVLRRIYGTDAPQITINFDASNVGERLRQLEEELITPLQEQRSNAPLQFPLTDSDASD